MVLAPVRASTTRLTVQHDRIDVTDHFDKAPDDRYFEDYVPGRTYDCGHVAVSATDIVDFGLRYDPQDMHVNPAVAAEGRFGSLIASGWHTAALAVRQVVAHYLSSVSSMASPGVDALRWPSPVRPGDTLAVRVHIIESIPSRSRADRGMVRARLEVTNQHNVLVLTAELLSIFGKRAGERSPQTNGTQAPD